MKNGKHIAWLLVVALLVAPSLGAAQDEGPDSEGAAEEVVEGSPPEEETLAPAPTADEPPPIDDEEPPSSEPPEDPVEHDDFRTSWITLGVRAGVYVPTLFNQMDPMANPTVEVGFLLPFLDRMLSIVADVGWAGPGRSEERTDPRIGPMGEGTYTYSMETHHLIVSGGLLFRFLVPGSVFVPYISAVARGYFLETNVEGEGEGNEFGRNTETSSQFGFAVSVGGELRLGPGAALLDVAFGYGDLPHAVTGETSTGSLAAQIGYRFFL